jgi:hypothetical protein
VSAPRFRPFAQAGTERALLPAVPAFGWHAWQAQVHSLFGALHAAHADVLPPAAQLSPASSSARKRAAGAAVEAPGAAGAPGAAAADTTGKRAKTTAE